MSFQRLPIEMITIATRYSVALLMEISHLGAEVGLNRNDLMKHYTPHINNLCIKQHSP
ncbi:MAG: hypothetical protein FWH37_07490 [Candidatus Bathyarchaeota archaeon]|nr:hypothetical protein [Candidatus Termiticorpusculum sp.]